MTDPAFWLVLAAVAALAVLARVVLHVPKSWHQGEMHGPVPRDGEPLTTWEASRWGWVTVLYQEDADDPQRGRKVRGRKR